jgi:hypothetical protein
MSVTQDKNDSMLGEVVPMALRYEAGKKSSVITQRSTVKYYPTTGTTVNSLEGRTSIFRLSASDFLDPRTAVLQFRLSVPNTKIRIEDLYTSLIQSITCTIGGVETSHCDNFGEAFKMVAYASCPEHIYKHQWRNTMGAYKYVPRNRWVARKAHATPGVSLLGGTDAATSKAQIQMGWVCDDTSFPMTADENYLAREFNNDGKRGVVVSIPLAELLGEFRGKTFLPLLFLGSIDITIGWAAFEKACLVGSTVQIADDNAKALAFENTAPNAANSRYNIDDLCIHTDLVSLDPTYVKLLQGVVSSSPQGLVIPYESYTTFNKSFTPSGGQDSLYISKGVSYLKRMFFGLRHVAHTTGAFVDKSQFKFADAHISHQTEVGGRLFPENRVTDLTTAYVELQKACDQQGSVDAGGILSFENYRGLHQGAVSDQTGPTTVPARGSIGVMAAGSQPHREIPQAFIMGQNFERALGSGGLLSGMNLKVSGYSVLFNIELKSVRKHPAGSQDLAYLEPNNALYGEQTQLLAVMHMDKAMTLRADAVSVSE